MKAIIGWALAAVLAAALVLGANGSGIKVGAENISANEKETRYNLLTNESFEEDIAGGEKDYELQYGAQQYTAQGEDDANVRTGSRSILLDCTDGQGKPFAKNTTLLPEMTLPLVSFNSEYELTMWFYAADGFRGYGFLRLYYNYDQDYGKVDEQNVAFANNENQIEGVWTKVTYRFTLKPSYTRDGVDTKVVGLRFVFFEMNVVTPGKLYIDDVSLCLANDENGKEVIPDMDITTSNPVFGNSGLDFSIDSSEYASNNGNCSLKVNITQEGANLYKFIDKENFENDIYIFSFYVKAKDAWRESGDYPHGLVALPIVARDNGITYFPEVMKYAGVSLRHYVQAYLPGMMRENGKLCGNGGLTLPTSESEKTDLEWTKVEIPFNPYALPDEVTSEDGSVTYRGSDVSQMCMMVKLGVKGTFWFDDFCIYRSGHAPESSAANAIITFENGKTSDDIAFMHEYKFPAATAKGVDGNGLYNVELTDIKVALEHFTGDVWTACEGYETAVGMSDESLTITPDMHGYYRMRYEVEHNGKTTVAYYNANVQDTLMSITVNSSAVNKEILYGQEIDVTGITVTKTMSYTGEAPLDGGWEVDLGGYTVTSAPGTYTVTVSYTETYGGTVTDTFDVVVKDYATEFVMLTPPEKLVYEYGEEFDKTGLTAQVTLAYGGNKTLEADRLLIVGYNPSAVGTQRVKAAYGSMEGEEFEVTVNDALNALTVNTDEVKKEYNEGEEIDLGGLVVEKVMKSGNRVTLNAGEYTVDLGGYTAQSPAGSYTITVSVTENGTTKTASFEITVRASAGGGCSDCSGSISVPMTLGAVLLGVAAIIKRRAL